MKLGPLIPVLRSFDEMKAREFYCGFLGFKVDFEHRFQPEAPLYMQVSRGGTALHLSEHHGDATPGSTVRIHVDDVEGLHRELMAKDYAFARPGLEDQPWGMREVIVADPFGNKLVFAQAITM
jgi:uncharacterized glyoxalase superfamily protein PhnB